MGFEDPTSRSRGAADRRAAAARWPTTRPSRSAAGSRSCGPREHGLKEFARCALTGPRRRADCMVTPCPLCHLAMDAYQRKAEVADGETYNMPVLRLPQLLGLALGLDNTGHGLQAPHGAVDQVLEVCRRIAGAGVVPDPRGYVRVAAGLRGGRPGAGVGGPPPWWPGDQQGPGHDRSVSQDLAGNRRTGLPLPDCYGGVACPGSAPAGVRLPAPRRSARRAEGALGPWGRVLTEQGEFRGMIQYGARAMFPRSRIMPAGPASADAAIVTCVYLAAVDRRRRPASACSSRPWRTWKAR